MKPKEVRGIIADLAQWQVVLPDARLILEAALLSEQHRISFWDALIVTTAKAGNANLVWSEDLQSGQSFGAVTVRNPFLRNTRSGRIE